MGRPWLVTGSTGKLGRHVVRVLAARGTPAVGLSRHPLDPRATGVDITDARALDTALDAADAPVVLHLAACSSVALSAADPAAARATNVDATAQVARWCAGRGARMVLVSSDFVFPGRPGGGYAEDEPPAPIDAYGASKAAAEEHVLAAPGALVVRSSLLYGRAPVRAGGGTGGGTGLLELLVTHALTGAPLRVTRREVRTPLHLADAAAALVRLAETDVGGVVHLAGPQALSAHDMAVAVCGWLGAPLRAEVVDVADAQSGPRPGDVSMDGTRLRSLLGEDAVRAFGPWALSADVAPGAGVPSTRVPHADTSSPDTPTPDGPGGGSPGARASGTGPPAAAARA